MAARLFFTLAIFFVATTTSVFSYEYPGYPTTRDRGIRQTRRCPTCPADCPESLSSPWYGSPTVYGKPISFNEDNRGYDQRTSTTSSFAGSENFPSEASSYNSFNDRSLAQIGTNSYANPFSSELNSCATGRCPYARYQNSRYARSGESLSPTPQVDEISDGSSFGSIEPLGFPFDFLTSLPSYIPPRYRQLGSIFALPHDKSRRVSRNYGTTYDNSPIGVDDYGKSVSRNSIYDDRLTAIETPSQEKVYVVYRADADAEDDAESLESVPIGTSGRQRHRAIEDTRRNKASTPMSDSQLEEIVRRAIAEATRENRQDDDDDTGYPGTSVEALRVIGYNEHEREGDESPYNPRRPYNDAIYQRFNPDEAIDRQLSARKIYSNGYENPQVFYEPSGAFSPEILSRFDPYPVIEDTKISNFENENDEKIVGETIPIANVEFNIESEVTDWKDDLESKKENFEKQNDDYEKEENKEKERISSVEVSRDIGSGAEDPKTRENYEEPKVPLPLMNYRTHSRSVDEEKREAKGEEITTPPTAMDKDYVERMMREANPDLVGEIEKPPIVTESTLRLNFEPLEASTPTPTS